MTPELLQAATGCTVAAAGLYAGPLGDACDIYCINTPIRLAAFLAQIAHESGSLRYVAEIASGQAYEGRADLGNAEAGDGPRYKGRGLLQVTGRANYRALAKALPDAPDFVAVPEALEQPKWAAMSAAHWWHAHNCNALADAGEFEKLSRLINRGNAHSTKPANGEDDRRARWAKAKSALGLYTSDQRVEKSAESMHMAPFLLAALPSLIESIPKLGRLFGSGSEVSERNLKAAELVASTVTAAVGARNEQEAVAKLQADPAAVAAATQAIDAIWYELTEAGGGGIDGARKADAARNPGGDLLHSASFWVGLLLLPLVYLLVLSLIGMIGTATWSDDVRAGLAGSLISAIIGGLVGYYYGTSTSRNRTAP